MSYEIDNTFHMVLWQAQHVIQRVNTTKGVDMVGYVHGPRAWHSDLQSRFALHPVIDKIVKLGVRPTDWQQLLLEWPHVSEEDETQIAYTRDDAKGLANVQTRTSIGKYLSRHWPHVADHVRRDWAGSFGNHKYDIWGTKEQIIAGVELGPQSCMKSGYGTIPFNSSDNYNLCEWFAGRKETVVRWDHHPYAVYAPEHGWRMAVRLDPCRPHIVTGRALLNVNSRTWVRSYKREEGGDDACSGTDERLEAWLCEQGYSKTSSWREGVRFARIEHPNGGVMMPYIDGNTQSAEDCGTHMVLDSDGRNCNNTDGTCDAEETFGSCEDCGSDIYESDDDRIWVGVHEGRLICGCCADSYRYVRGQDDRGRERDYYVHEDAAVQVNDYWYDRENLPDSVCVTADGDYEMRDDCVCCENGDYRLVDECVQCETDDGWYAKGDEDVVQVENTDTWYRTDDDTVVACADKTYRLRDDCWEDAHSGDWYSDDEKQITLGGETYHPDTLRKLAASE